MILLGNTIEMVQSTETEIYLESRLVVYDAKLYTHKCCNNILKPVENHSILFII